MLKPYKLISLSSIYTGIWIVRQGTGKSFFCQPKALPNETLPAHTAAEIAGRVHFERVTFSSPAFSSLSLCLPTTPFAVDLFSDGCLEKIDMIGPQIFALCRPFEGRWVKTFIVWRPSRFR